MKMMYDGFIRVKMRLDKRVIPSDRVNNSSMGDHKGRDNFRDKVERVDERRILGRIKRKYEVHDADDDDGDDNDDDDDYDNEKELRSDKANVRWSRDKHGRWRWLIERMDDRFVTV